MRKRTIAGLSALYWAPALLWLAHLRFSECGIYDGAIEACRMGLNRLLVQSTMGAILLYAVGLWAALRTRRRS